LGTNDDSVEVRTRRRDLPFHGGNGRLVETQTSTHPLYPFYNKDVTDNVWRPKNLQGSETTVSEYHPSWRRYLNARHDIGGPFENVKQYVEPTSVPPKGFAHSQFYPPYTTNTWKYTGPVIVDNMVGVTFPPSARSTDDVLNAVGAGAIARINPTNSVAQASTALLEVYREGLPKAVGASMWKLRLDDLVRGSADDYLNVAFGWNPLLSEIRDFSHGINNTAKLIEQFHRDSGKVVRRRFSYPPETATETLVHKSEVAAPHTLSSFPQMYTPVSERGKVMRIRTTTIRRWFSGAFTYNSSLGTYYQPAEKLSALGYDARRLLGLEITPTTLYNLAPWSWAVDWVSSVGDVLANLEAQQRYGLVMPYGYLMEHSIVKDSYVWSGPNPMKGGAGISPLTLVTETKLRRPANPFGFGLTWDSLNATQQAILASLGISKKKHR
jgi:hypothetical protein